MGQGGYENPWTYKNTTFTSDDIDDFFGFVYCITNNTNGREYIGRKYFWKFRTPRGKKRKVKSESDWKIIMGVVRNLKKKFNNWVDTTLAELSSAYIKQLAKQTSKKRGNSLSKECLQNNLTMAPPSTTIVTSSPDTSEKTIMELDTTDKVVAHVRDWSVDKIEESELVGDKMALYAEFEEWIELDDIDNIEIYSLEEIEKKDD